MIHIKETEIIPLLKEAQTEYSQKITEGDPKDVEMAERIEEALTQAMDIVYDYQSMADEHKRMVEKCECLMPNTGECPKEESVSTLSQILEETPHQKYYLSEKACLGILRRAEKRGKELPEILRLALIRQAQMMSSAMTSATDAG